MRSGGHPLTWDFTGAIRLLVRFRRLNDERAQNILPQVQIMFQSFRDFGSSLEAGVCKDRFFFFFDRIGQRDPLRPKLGGYLTRMLAHEGRDSGEIFFLADKYREFVFFFIFVFVHGATILRFFLDRNRGVRDLLAFIESFYGWSIALARRNETADDDVFLKSAQTVDFRLDGGLHQHARRILE